MFKTLLRVLPVALAAWLAACAPAATPSATDHAHGEGIEVHNVWARPASLSMGGQATPMAGMSGGGMHGSGVNSAVYFEMHNHGTTADTLLRAESDVARLVELHETKMVDNMMQMIPQDKIEVLADADIKFKPGGLHVMLIDLKRDLNVGDKFNVTLVFEKAGPITIEAEVRQP